MKRAGLLFYLSPALLLAEMPSALAIRDARVVTVSGPVLARGTVVVRNGLIEEIGENVTVPADAWVIQGEGLSVYPGLIDALSTWGLPDANPPPPPTGRASGSGPTVPPSTPPTPRARGPEDRPSTSSWIRAADLIQPSDRRLESARSAGFTTAVTYPARGILAGQGAVVNLAGEKPGQMIVHSPSGLYTTFTTNRAAGYPGSLMGVIAYLRQIYLDAGYYRTSGEMYAKNAVGMQRPAYDKALEGVLGSPRILLPAMRAVEIDRMLRLGIELKTKVLLYGAHEAYRVADLLKRSGVPVLVSLKWPEARKDADPEEQETLRTLELREQAPGTPQALARASVDFAFYSDGLSDPQDLWKAVRKAIAAGLPRASAVRALTLGPAEIYGVADRLGSIDKGKIANLVVTRGDLFDDRTKVQFVLIDGVKYEPPTDSGQDKKEAGTK